MRTIFRIFHNDIKSIFRNVFVLVIVLVMGVMPALYAWINIYACWDPYGSTGNMAVAISSRDRGIDLNTGAHLNKADEIIDSVRDDTDIKYVPMEDPEEAIAGVRAGEYYAAVIFEDGFTYDMEHFEEAIADEDAKITYYPNTKKSAISPKVTDGTTESLLLKINEEYLRTVLHRFFGDVNAFSDTLDTDDAVDEAIGQLTEARDALKDFDQSITLALSGSEDISSSLSSLKKHLDSDRKKSKDDIRKARKAYNQVGKDLKSVSREIRERVSQLDRTIKALEEIAEALQKPIDEQERQRLIAEAENLLDDMLTILQNLRAMIPDDSSSPASKIVAAALDLMIDMTERIEDDLKDPDKIEEIAAELEELKRINKEELRPALESILSEIRSALKLTKPLLSSTTSLLEGIDPVLGSAGKTMTSLDKMLIRLHATIGPLENRLDEIIQEVNDADEEDRAGVLLDLLGGDPDRYTDFFISPVKIHTEELYPTVSYGAAMAPFYSIIALWVGGVVLITLLKTNINRRKFPEATETQSFFGRFLLFFLIGQIQAAVIVAGDIFLLHCSPVHPWLMWFSASVTSMVFVMLIYALVLAFGNVGRAAVIVIMVLQISGSSGSFPIEILPELFGKIYRFFPYPYAINAMRETICGMYGHDFFIYLGQLVLFIAVALAIGLFIRRPFIGVDRYVTEKLEETEVL